MHVADPHKLILGAGPAAGLYSAGGALVDGNAASAWLILVNCSFSHVESAANDLLSDRDAFSCARNIAPAFAEKAQEKQTFRTLQRQQGRLP